MHFRRFVKILHLKAILIVVFTFTGFYVKLTGKPRSTCITIDSMSPSELIRNVYRYSSSACRIIHDYGGKMSSLLNGLGQLTSYKLIDGQKSMCMDPNFTPQFDNCLVYSFGINNEWSFDEAVERLGCHIYAFDPSMNATDHDHSPRIHFLKIGLGVADVEIDPVTGWKLMTLESIHKMLQRRHGDVNIDYLKIDIEFAEWAVIPQIIRSGIIRKVKQMGIEIHLSDSTPVDLLKHKLKVLKSLEDSGFVRFAFRPNFMTDGFFEDKLTFLAFELAWYNSKFTDTGNLFHIYG